MPRNLAPKLPSEEEVPSRGEGPSNESQIAQELINKCPKTSLDKKLMPKFLGRPMPVHLFSLAYAGYWWFKVDERLLVKEELLGLMSIFYNESISWRPLLILLRTLEKPEKKIQNCLENLTDQDKEILKHLVGSAFARLLEDPVVSEVCRCLSGL